MFIEIAASAAHLRQVDAPLLAAYVQGLALADHLCGPENVAAWERTTRTVAMLARSLRLTPQSRIDPRTVARRLPDTAPSAYETMDDSDD